MIETCKPSGAHDMAPARAREGAESPSWHDRRDLLYARLRDPLLVDVDEEEVDAHFKSMPARYWEQVSEAGLVWDLQMVHTFFARLAEAEPDSAEVAVDWRHDHEQGVTKALVCTWDRHGLLAKIAAAFSAMRVSIIRADAYTRTDNVVLDVFEVCDLDHRSMLDPARLQAVTFLIEGALCQPPRFASIWAAQSHKWRPSADQITPRVRGDNRSSPEHTVLRVEASDRRGLLYDILQTLTDCDVSVSQAVINTIDGVALDVFYLVDAHERKITNAAALRRICRKVSRAILSPHGE